MTMDVSFCLDALEQALRVAQPEVFHSDQGAQLTSAELTSGLEEAGIQISMDGRGRHWTTAVSSVCGGPSHMRKSI